MLNSKTIVQGIIDAPSELIHVRASVGEHVRRQDRLPGAQRPDVKVVNAGHPGLTEDGGANR
jgi:hypothetical protein